MQSMSRQNLSGFLKHSILCNKDNNQNTQRGKRTLQNVVIKDCQCRGSVKTLANQRVHKSRKSVQKSIRGQKKTLLIVKDRSNDNQSRYVICGSVRNRVS